MDNEQIRKDFGQWVTSSSPLELYGDFGNKIVYTHLAWSTWKAAAAHSQKLALPAWEAIEKSQVILAKYLVPDSTMNKQECISALLGVLDHVDLLSAKAAYRSATAPDCCQCEACHGVIRHASDCAVHNMPADPNGPCDCGVSNE